MANDFRAQALLDEPRELVGAYFDARGLGVVIAHAERAEPEVPEEVFRLVDPGERFFRDLRPVRETR